MNSLGAVPATANSGRAAFLEETCGLLWPTASGGPGRVTELMVLPGARRPRLVVPADRRVSAAAVRRYGEPRSLRSRMGVRGLSLLLRSGVGGVVLRDRVRLEVPAGASSIESYLGDQLGTEVEVSMYVGAPRANRKPVLQLLSPNGAALGFAKIGITPLAKRLVGDERNALVLLGEAGLEHVTPPTVLHHGVWHDMVVLVLGPLAVDARRVPLTKDSLNAAMLEVSNVAGVERLPLASSSHWASVRARLATAEESADRELLLTALDAIGRRYGSLNLQFGSWHGDWTPWNMANTRDGLLVWDWERFRVGVPVGFDAMHHWLQGQVAPGKRDPLAAARDCPVWAPKLLAPLGVNSEQARLTALLYMAELATRSLVDRQAAAGARLGASSQWLIPALVAELGEM